MSLHNVPQRLYDSEINFSISCFWDGGFVAKIGDTMDGFAAVAMTRTYREALEWLDMEVRLRYPGSRYAVQP